MMKQIIKTPRKLEPKAVCAIQLCPALMLNYTKQPAPVASIQK